MMLLRRVARPLIAGLFINEGLATARNPKSKVEKAAPVVAAVKDVTGIAADDVDLIKANGAIMFGAGVMFSLNKFPRLSALLMAGTLVPTTLVSHRFWDEEPDSEARATQRIQFVKNASVLGGLMLAAADTEGRPGLGWRARRAAKDTERLVSTAQREAKLASSLAQAKLEAAAAPVTAALK